MFIVPWIFDALIYDELSAYDELIDAPDSKLKSDVNDVTDINEYEALIDADENDEETELAGVPINIGSIYDAVSAVDTLTDDETQDALIEFIGIKLIEEAMDADAAYDELLINTEADTQDALIEA